MWVQLYLFLRYSGIGAIWRNWVWIPQIMCRNTWKVIQSLHPLVSHQMRLYSRIRTFCGLSYTSFTCIGVFLQFWETAPKYPKRCTGTHEKLLKVFSSLFQIKWDFNLKLERSTGWAIPFTGMHILEKFWETVPKYPKSCAWLPEK